MFKLKGNPNYSATEMLLDVKMHKAISVIQFKVEGQIIKKNPGFKLENAIYCIILTMKKGTIELDGKEYKLLIKFSDDRSEKPYALTKEEEDIMERLERAFENCENYSVICISFETKVDYIKYITAIFFIMVAYR